MTVLALLLSLLLGYAPAAASVAAADRSAARPGKSEVAKSGAVLRTGGRFEPDDQDHDELLGAAPAQPVTRLLWQHPAAGPAASATGTLGPALAHSYRARAPPAA